MATEQQIPKLAGSLVEHQSGFSALSTDDAQFVITETKKAIAFFVEAIKNRAKATTGKLLEYVTSVTVPSVKRFVVDDHFKDGKAVDGVKVFLGGNFKKRFRGKIEEDVAGCDIRVQRLLKAAKDLSIRYEIGENNEETFLANLWHFLKLQGEKGRWFVFYIRDANGIPWAVSAYWNGGDWDVDAYSVEYRGRWSVGDCICSR